MRLVVRYNRRSRKGFRGIYGYQYRKGSERRIVVNLDFHGKECRQQHRGVRWLLNELIRTIDHEIAHAFAPQYYQPRTAKGWIEERFVKTFENAGAWARR